MLRFYMIVIAITQGEEWEAQVLKECKWKRIKGSNGRAWFCKNDDNREFKCTGKKGKLQFEQLTQASLGSDTQYKGKIIKGLHNLKNYTYKCTPTSTTSTTTTTTASSSAHVALFLPSDSSSVDGGDDATSAPRVSKPQVSMHTIAETPNTGLATSTIILITVGGILLLLIAVVVGILAKQKTH